MPRFWMTYVEGRSGAPAKKHDTYAAAQKEAERLAIQTGAKVFLLKSTDYCEVSPQPVTWHDGGDNP
jgi:hypothetical protein